MNALSNAAQTNPGPAGIIQLQELLLRILNLSVGLAFIVVTIMLIVAGFKFLTSGGDAKAIGAASQTITWALLGIIFLVLSWLILKLFEAITGIPVTLFCFSFSGC